MGEKGVEMVDDDDDGVVVAHHHHHGYSIFPLSRPQARTHGQRPLERMAQVASTVKGVVICKIEWWFVLERGENRHCLE